jgi:Flp pilus assembly protein TadG
MTMNVPFWRRALQHVGGAAALEFALLAPLLILIAIGTTDYAIFTVKRQQLAAAARAAAQYALTYADPYDGYNSSTNPVLGAAKTLGIQLAPAGSTGTVTYYCQCVTSANVVVPESNCVTPTCTPLPVQNYVQAALSGTYTTLINYPGFPASISMSSTTILRKR